MKFFLDENLPQAEAEALRVLNGREHEIEHVFWKYGKSTKDYQWIPPLGAVYYPQVCGPPSMAHWHGSRLWSPRRDFFE